MRVTHCRGLQAAISHHRNACVCPRPEAPVDSSLASPLRGSCNTRVPARGRQRYSEKWPIIIHAAKHRTARNKATGPFVTSCSICAWGISGSIMLARHDTPLLKSALLTFRGPFPHHCNVVFDDLQVCRSATSFDRTQVDGHIAVVHLF